MQHSQNQKVKIIGGIAALLIIGAGSFYAGTWRQKSQSRAEFSARTGGPQMFGGTGGTMGGARGGRTFGMNGGATAGEIIAQDATSITIKSPDGSTRIILLSDKTEILKPQPGTQADLATGSNVVVTGTSNADGSLTAQNIQLRTGTTTTRIMPR